MTASTCATKIDMRGSFFMCPHSAPGPANYCQIFAEFLPKPKIKKSQRLQWLGIIAILSIFPLYKEYLNGG